MQRVYASLKAQVMEGKFAPGERLDPARLSHDLFASVTPVRDALQRLTGERLVETWTQEGFHMPIVTEAGLRDLYGWSGEVMNLVVAAAVRARTPPLRENLSEGGDIGRLFTSIASRSPNFEHRIAVAGINDRLQAARAAEHILIDDRDQRAVLRAALASGNWRDVRAPVAALHRLRLRRAVAIAAALRPRDHD